MAILWPHLTNWLSSTLTPLWKSSETSAERPVRSWLCSARSNGSTTGIKKTLHAAEQNREDIKRLREQWLEELPSLDPHRLVFIDESGAKTNMTRLRGRALHGSRLFACAPHGHWCTTTMISAIRLNGQTAALEVEGPSDGSVFREYVRSVLVPSLHSGDIVVMDNLRTHYDAEALRLIEVCGAIVKFLPPYSPDFNPIEKMWSKIKTRLRSLAARTQEELSVAISRAFA